ncbi:putative F-box/LRR-repeat protein 9 [Nicotiana tabacum]|uniref:F-box/LRR-repeat protein 23 n=1 Tax=Nicotiana tabacum TaxID=4097 RepID=A0A1S3XZ53_TOBAC|nr:PREDICTED: putative F-box/LRR-repeat protein 23 [Nicotiana tabacum]
MPWPKRRKQKKRRARQKNPKTSSSRSSPPQLSPPWVELPLEITADILQRVGVIDILNNAQRVCSTWWKVCHDPVMWRVIDMINDVNSDLRYDLDKIEMCKVAVDRSQGQLVKINIENIGDIDLFNHIAERSSQLRHLRLVRCHCIIFGCLAAAAKNFPLLEELHLYFSVISYNDMEVIGHSCPMLKSFTSNAYGFLGFSPPRYLCDDQALAVARSMPELRHLILFGNILTNEGLQAILDGCPHLESLDVRHCYNLSLEGDLGRRCKQQIVDLKLPHDSTYGYQFDADIFDHSSRGADYSDQSSDYSVSDDDVHWLSDTSVGHRDHDDHNDYYD